MSADKRRITIEDLNKITTLGDPNISPDGQWIAYVQTSPNPQEDSYTNNIYVIASAGGEPIQLTRGGKDSSPRWSPDGKTLAFVSARNQKPQIYLFSLTFPGGEPRALTSMENGATMPVWSPDGQHIAFLAGMNADERAKEDAGEKPAPPADKLEGKYREDRKAEDEKRRWDPRPMWRIPYRAGTSYLDDRFAQIYIVPTANGLEADAAKPRRMTNTDVNHEQPDWTADGKFIYTSRTVDEKADVPWRWQNIIRINVENGEETRIEDNDYSVFTPRLSPDGKWLACVRMPRDITDRLVRFTLMSLDGNETRDLTGWLDRSVNDFVWSSESKLIYTAASWGNLEPYQYDPATDTHEKLSSGVMNITGVDIATGGSLALTIATPQNPSELFWWSKGNPVKQITSVNQKFLDEVIVQEVHEIRFQSPGGEIQGWYVLPVGYQAGQKSPLALNIHGGPHIMWGAPEPSMWHEWQVFAARGYVAFWCNPHGADGYGDAFTYALHANWGGVAMDDIMAGVDTLISKGLIDTEKMGLTGGSYGGYMTAWIIGHNDRFKAAVSHRGVYNMTSFYGTSDVPLLISSEYGVTPWENQTLLWEHSPVAYAHNIKTPLLIMHAENDFRVPIEQGEQLFAIVRRATQTPVRMLRFPREGHELTRSGEPRHRVQSMTEMLNWFDTYCDVTKPAD